MGIRAVVTAPDWSSTHRRGEAKCRAPQFLPARGDDLFFESEPLAMSVCNGDVDGIVCPRRTECLYVAMVNREAYGVWGGMTPGDRLALRMRYPGMPERWTWHPPIEETLPHPEEQQWPAAS